MDDTDRVLARLARIERLRGSGAEPELLDELRALIPEAEAWARAEGDARAREAAQRLGRAGLGSTASDQDRGLDHETTQKLREEAEGMS
jgi:hypothetical protein